MHLFKVKPHGRVPSYSGKCNLKYEAITSHTLDGQKLKGWQWQVNGMNEKDIRFENLNWYLRQFIIKTACVRNFNQYSFPLNGNSPDSHK